EGAAEDIPDELDAKKLKSTVSALLKKHDPEIVRVYLHLFQLQRSEGWPGLTKLIEETPELQFAEAPGAEAPGAEAPVEVAKAPNAAKPEPPAEKEEVVAEAVLEEESDEP